MSPTGIVSQLEDEPPPGDSSFRRFQGSDRESTGPSIAAFRSTTSSSTAKANPHKTIPFPADPVVIPASDYLQTGIVS